MFIHRENRNFLIIIVLLFLVNFVLNYGQSCFCLLLALVVIGINQSLNVMVSRVAIIGVTTVDLVSFLLVVLILRSSRLDLYDSQWGGEILCLPERNL